MRELLESFSFNLRDWQNIKALLLHLKQNRKGTDDLISYIDNLPIVAKRPQKDSSKNSRRIIRLCPKCRTIMRLLPVNINKATQTGDKSEFVWLCSNEACMYTEYK